MKKKNCKLFLNISFCFFVLISIVYADWEPDVRLTNDPNRSYVASLKNARCIAAKGDTVHAVWYDDRNGNWEIYYKRSTDAGLNWSSDIRLTTDPDSSQFAALAISGSNVHVAWHDHRDGNYEIYYTRSTDAGITWETEKRLTYDPMNSYHPTIAASGSLIFILWNDWREGEWEIYHARSTDNGTNWSSDKRLSDSTDFSAYPSVAVVDSIVHAVWVDDRDGNDEIYHKYSTNAGLTWSSDQRLTNAPDLSWYPSVAAAGSNVHVAWNDYRYSNMEIYYKRSTDFGANWSSDMRFTNDPNFSGYTALATSGSNVHLVWYDIPSNSEIFYKRSTDNGENWSANTRLTNATSSSMYASVSATGPYVHVLWEDARDNNFEIYYKRNPTGNIGINEIQMDKTSNSFKAYLTSTGIRFQGNLPLISPLKFCIYNSLGNQVTSFIYEPTSRSLSFVWQPHNLASGIYFVSVSQKQGFQAKTRIVWVK